MGLTGRPGPVVGHPIRDVCLNSSRNSSLRTCGQALFTSLAGETTRAHSYLVLFPVSIESSVNFDEIVSVKRFQIK